MILPFLTADPVLTPHAAPVLPELTDLGDDFANVLGRLRSGHVAELVLPAKTDATEVPSLDVDEVGSSSTPEAGDSSTDAEYETVDLTETDRDGAPHPKLDMENIVAGPDPIDTATLDLEWSLGPLGSEEDIPDIDQNVEAMEGVVSEIETDTDRIVEFPDSVPVSMADAGRDARSSEMPPPAKSDLEADGKPARHTRNVEPPQVETALQPIHSSPPTIQQDSGEAKHARNEAPALLAPRDASTLPRPIPSSAPDAVVSENGAAGDGLPNRIPVSISTSNSPPAAEPGRRTDIPAETRPPIATDGQPRDSHARRDHLPPEPRSVDPMRSGVEHRRSESSLHTYSADRSVEARPPVRETDTSIVQRAVVRADESYRGWTPQRSQMKASDIPAGSVTPNYASADAQTKSARLLDRRHADAPQPVFDSPRDGENATSAPSAGQTNATTVSAMPGAATAGIRPTVALPQVHAVADAVVSARTDQIELRLSPEELGRVRISIGAGEAGLSVTISAERDDTHALLRRHASDLQTALSDLGLGSATIAFGDGRAGGQRKPASSGGAPGAGREDETSRPTEPLPGRLDMRL